MKNIEDIINKLNSELKETKEVSKAKRVYLSISPENFLKIFILNANIILASRNVNIEYEIDDENKYTINQLYYYVTGSNEFNGDLNKGIMLSGKVGTGKTVMMLAMKKMIESLSNKIVTYVHSKRVIDTIAKKGKEYFDTRPLIIDDIGKETKIVNDFGTIKSPIPDLFAIRYDFGAWTFATNNYSQESLLEFYGESIVDRFTEMFNNLILQGGSRRR